MGEREIAVPISFGDGAERAGTLAFRYSLLNVLAPIAMASALIASAWLLLFRRFRRNLIIRHEELIRADSLRVKAEVAAQVGHDIRAPLAALTVLEGEIGVLPENTRMLLKGAMDRIQAIAKSLLDSQRGEIGRAHV